MSFFSSIGNFFGKAASAVGNVASKATSAIKTAGQKGGDWLKGVGDKIKPYAQKFGQYANKTLTTIVNAYVPGVGDALQNGLDALGNKAFGTEPEAASADLPSDVMQSAASALGQMPDGSDEVTLGRSPVSQAAAAASQLGDNGGILHTLSQWSGIGDGKPGVLGIGDGKPGVLGIGTGSAKARKEAEQAAAAAGASPAQAQAAGTRAAAAAAEPEGPASGPGSGIAMVIAAIGALFLL